MPDVDAAMYSSARSACTLTSTGSNTASGARVSAPASIDGSTTVVSSVPSVKHESTWPVESAQYSVSRATASAPTAPGVLTNWSTRSRPIGWPPFSTCDAYAASSTSSRRSSPSFSIFHTLPE